MVRFRSRNLEVKTGLYQILYFGLGLNWIAFEQAILTYLFEVVEFVTV